MSVKELNVQYAGVDNNQVQAAGALIFAQDTGNFLIVYRSPDVVDPSVWCGPGGKIEVGETPEQASRREIAEEIGYTGKMIQVPLFTWDEPDLKFYNFLGIVPKQFHPVLNWETSGHIWCKLKNSPEPKHYGLQALLDDEVSLEVIRTTQRKYEHAAVEAPVEGTYSGLWTGYVIAYKARSNSGQVAEFKLTTKTGVRGVNIPTTVKVVNGVASQVNS